MTILSHNYRIGIYATILLCLSGCSHSLSISTFEHCGRSDATECHCSEKSDASDSAITEKLTGCRRDMTGKHASDHSWINDRFCAAVIERAEKEQQETNRQLMCDNFVLVQLQNTLGGMFQSNRFQIVDVASKNRNGTSTLGKTGEIFPKNSTSRLSSIGLLLKHQGAGGYRNLCTGTLLDDRHVLTAAHCFLMPHASDNPNFDSLRVQLFCLSKFAYGWGFDSKVSIGECKGPLKLLFDKKVLCDADKKSDKSIICEDGEDNLETIVQRSEFREWVDSLNLDFKSNWKFQIHGRRPLELDGVVFHPKYSVFGARLLSRDKLPAGSLLKDGFLKYDLAVVKLKNPLQGVRRRFEDSCDSHDCTVGDRETNASIIIGYGAAGNLNQSFDAGIKRLARVNITRCPYDTRAYKGGDEYLCWKHTSSTSDFGTACPGDSGAPILRNGKIVGIVSQSTENKCQRFSVFDRSRLEVGLGPRLDIAAKAINDGAARRWVLEILTGLSSTDGESVDEFHLVPAKLDNDELGACHWLVDGEFRKKSVFEPLAKSTRPLQNFHKYRLCAQDSQESNLLESNVETKSTMLMSKRRKLAVTLNANIGSGFDRWRDFDYLERDINLFVVRRNSVFDFISHDDGDHITSPQIVERGLDEWLVGTSVYTRIDPPRFREAIECLGVGPSTNENCVVNISSHLNKPEPRTKLFSTIGVQALNYEGHYQLIISTNPTNKLAQ